MEGKTRNMHGVQWSRSQRMEGAALGRYVRFEGRSRQEAFLKRYQQLNRQGQKAFRDIYQQAHQQGERHIIQSAVAASRHTPLRQFSKMNIMLRVALAYARNNQDHARIRRIEEALEDFHIATLAFYERCSLDEAVKARQAEIQTLHQGHHRPKSPNLASDDEHLFRWFHPHTPMTPGDEKKFRQFVRQTVQEIHQFRQTRPPSE